MSNEAVVKNEDYYMEHQEEYDALSEDDKTQLLLGNLVNKGDTAGVVDDKVDDKAAETVAAPDATKSDSAKVDTDKEVAAEVVDDKQEPVIQAKDGKNIIPYSELLQARADTEHWQKIAQEKTELADSLAEAKAKDAETGGTDAQEAVMADLKENFPELAELLAPVMKSMIEFGVKEQVAQFKKELDAAIAPIKKSTETTEIERHFNSIAAAHSDYETVLDGKEFKSWVDKQPAYAKPGIEQILKQGTATDVIGLLTSYKEANPVKTEIKTEKLSAEQLAAKAKEVTDKTASGVPASLTDVPAGSTVHHDENEALMEMHGLQLVDKFSGKTPKQIEDMLAKVV